MEPRPKRELDMPTLRLPAELVEVEEPVSTKKKKTESKYNDAVLQSALVESSTMPSSNIEDSVGYELVDEDTEGDIHLRIYKSPIGSPELAAATALQDMATASTSRDTFWANTSYENVAPSTSHGTFRARTIPGNITASTSRETFRAAPEFGPMIWYPENLTVTGPALVSIDLTFEDGDSETSGNVMRDPTEPFVEEQIEPLKLTKRSRKVSVPQTDSKTAKPAPK